MKDDEIIHILKSLIASIENSKIEHGAKQKLVNFLSEPESSNILKYVFLGWYMYNFNFLKNQGV
jgi:hypothetical protein